MTLRRWLLATALLLGGSTLACGPLRVPLVVVSRPDDADVFVNDRFVGAANMLARKRVRVVPGKLRLEVRRQGYYPHYADLDVPKEAKEAVLRVELRRTVGDSDPDNE